MVESEYAKAVFDLAKEENKIEVFTNCFNAVIDTKTKEFSDILVSPFIHKEEKKRILSKVYHSLDETFLHFLYVLIIGKCSFLFKSKIIIITSSRQTRLPPLIYI